METRIPPLGARGEGWVALQVLLFVVIAIAGFVFLDARAGSVMLVPALVGGAAIVCGGLVALWAVRTLGASLSALPHPTATNQLVESGPYAAVRHPIYSGLLLAALGWSVLSLSWLALLFSLCLAAVLDLKSRREEAWLVDRHPDYAAYRSRTRRFVPGIY